MRSQDLTSGDLAVLGHLALRPWSAYDLVQEMRRNVHFFWPRVESGLYRTLSRLTQCKLASISTERNGGRRRTVYGITKAGQRALDQWMESECAPPWMELEAVMRVFLTAPEDAQRLPGVLRSWHAHAVDLQDVAARVGAEYVSGVAPFQHMIATRALIFDYLSGLARFNADWAERSEALLNKWGRMGLERREKAAQEHISECLRMMTGRTGVLDRG